MTEPVYQSEFECTNCESKGYVQSTNDPVFCPNCGDQDDVEFWEAEFNIFGEQTEPEVIEKVTERVVYKNKIVYREKKPSSRDGYHGPPTGHTDVDHKIKRDRPVVTSTKRDNKRRIYTVDCGFTGLRATIIWHLHTRHGFTQQEAKDICKVANHEWKNITKYPPVCNDKGARPVTGAIIDYKLDPGEVRRYMFKLSCGYEGLRSSTMKHLVVHHGYTREEGSEVINIKKGNVDMSNLSIPVNAPCSNAGAHPVTAEVLGYKLDAGETRRHRFRIKECGYEGVRPSVMPHLVSYHGYSKDEAKKVISFRAGNVDMTSKDVRLDG